jgi:hypothetical protein
MVAQPRPSSYHNLVYSSKLESFSLNQSYCYDSNEVDLQHNGPTLRTEARSNL